MATITRRNVKGHIYYYAVESKRVNGKPRLVMQKYLGTAQDIMNAVDGVRRPLEPRKVRLFTFGGVAAAWDMAQRLRLIEHIDRHVPKRDQGVSVGQYLTLAAINRCVSPKSKRAFAEWYATTVLSRLCPVPDKLLASQRFWDHMQRLDADTIARIECDLTEHLLSEFDLDLRCLAYDTTNFFTFIGSFNARSTLARRGKSKEHRSDLRIVGLALLVSMDFHVPLFHHAYPGNVHDSKTLRSITDELLARYRLLCKHCEDITVVFDKGNNSKENLENLEGSPYHFVGSLPYDQHRDLLEIPRSRFSALSHPRLEAVEAYRLVKQVMGCQRTVLVTYNENLYLAQLQSIVAQMRKCCNQLHEIKTALRRRAQGRIKNGNKPTAEGVKKQVERILKPQHMKKLIRTEIAEKNGTVTLRYRCLSSALATLSRRVLGKTILFTDNSEWTNEEIVLAYRGQSQVEDAFRTMKNPHFISFRPIHHWTDPMIRVHAFYCVLALTMASLLVRNLHQKGIEITIPRVFDLLNRIDTVALIWPRPPGRPSRMGVTQKKDTITLSEMTAEQARIFEALDLKRYHPSVV